MISADEAVQWTTRLAGLCAAYMSVEVLVDRQHYADHGLLGWPVMRSRHRALVASAMAPVASALLRYPVFLAMMGARLAAGLVLATMAPSGDLRTALLALTLVANLLFQLRTAFGTDGADQMNTLTLGALVVDAVSNSPLVRAAALWFQALQLVLSYFIAGVAKLRGEEWRQGRAPTLIFSTRMYGVPPFGRWLGQHPRVSWLMAWIVIVTETSYPLVFVAPPSLAMAIMAGGLGFHVFTAFAMGLNTFFWAFTAAYPALIWCVLPST
jgi:hypothetical protein